MNIKFETSVCIRRVHIVALQIFWNPTDALEQYKCLITNQIF
jgi:hypothetical protein